MAYNVREWSQNHPGKLRPPNPNPNRNPGSYLVDSSKELRRLSIKRKTEADLVAPELGAIRRLRVKGMHKGQTALPPPNLLPLLKEEQELFVEISRLWAISQL